MEHIIRAAQPRCDQWAHIAEFDVEAQHVGPTRVIQPLNEAGRSDGTHLACCQVCLPERVNESITIGPRWVKQAALTGQRAEHVGDRSCRAFLGWGKRSLDCRLDLLAASRCTFLLVEFQCHLSQGHPASRR